MDQDKRIMIEISPGELWDRLTILDVKLNNIPTDEVVKLDNVNFCYEKTMETYLSLVKIEAKKTNWVIAKDFYGRLYDINNKLWKVEDKLREYEREKIFDSEFIKLARSVYKLNDKRFKLKRKIDKIFGSKLLEEKSYEKY